MWNYRIEAMAGDDVVALVMARHTAHIARYPGASQAHAIAATPEVAKAATLAAEQAKEITEGPILIEVSGPDPAVGEQSDDPDGIGESRNPFNDEPMSNYVPLVATATAVV